MNKISLLVLVAINILSLECTALSAKSKDDVLQGKADPVLALVEASNLSKLMEKSRLSFTFNVKLPDKTVSRSWVWDINKNLVYLDGKLVKTGDKRFVNDKYWLLFPLMAHFDRGNTRVSMNLKSQSPVSNQTCIEVTVEYINGGGYTPNDVYKLYCNEDMRIFEWAYYKGGQEPPARITKWIDYNDFNGVLLSLTRPSAGNFKVWFTDVSIE